MNLYPALTARMGVWQYYIVKMTMHELAAEVDFASKVYEDRTLDDAIQRQLNEGRVKKEIVSFLSRRADRFFASIVVSALGGSPKFYPVNITDDERFEVFKDQQLDQAFGVLTFAGGQKYYALDGQHRLKAIKTLLDKDDPDSHLAPEGFAEEEISVLMIVRQEETDKAFLRSYRRLFSSLNRHAKATDEDTNIIMDEDDAFSILTRRLITEHEFFQWAGKHKESVRVKTKGKNITTTDSYFTSLQTLYAMNETLLTSVTRENNWPSAEDPEKREGTKTFKRFRPDEEYLDALYDELLLYWNALITVLPDLEKDPTTMRVHSVDEGGENSAIDNLLFWPIGQELLAKISRNMLNKCCPNDENVNKESVTSCLSRLGKIDWCLHNPPWRFFMLVHDPNRDTWRMRNEDRSAVLKIAERILNWLVGQDLLDKDIRELRLDWETRLIPAQEEEPLNELWKNVEEMRLKVLS